MPTNRVGIPSSCWIAITTPAFATAIELGHDETGKIDRGVKFPRLGERVAAGGGINDEKPFVRRLRDRVWRASA